MLSSRLGSRLEAAVLTRLSAVVVVAGFVLVPNVAWGQRSYYPAPAGNLRRQADKSAKPPTVSPYVNMYRDNMPAWFNYYTLVRPMAQQQQYNAREAALIGRLQGQADALNGAAATTNLREPARGTRRASRFMDPSGYYGRRE